jgi:hypothetical protein
MDTETVLKIIEKLDSRIKTVYDVWNETGGPVVLHRMYELENFRYALQEYIESQVNQVENEMNRGD